MRSILIVGLASFLVAGAAQAAATVCKGLDEKACQANSICTWRKALIAGETTTQAGNPAKRNVKAHCRKGRAQSSPQAGKPAIAS